MLNAMTIPNCAKGRATATTVLNVRDLATTASRAVGRLQKGQAVTIWAVDGDWAIVQTDDGLTGWCHTGWLNMGELIP